jgi:outer membrane protein insertion porin family
MMRGRALFALVLVTTLAAMCAGTLCCADATSDSTAAETTDAPEVAETPDAPEAAETPDAPAVDEAPDVPEVAETTDAPADGPPEPPSKPPSDDQPGEMVGTPELETPPVLPQGVVADEGTPQSQPVASTDEEQETLEPDSSADLLVELAPIVAVEVVGNVHIDTDEIEAAIGSEVGGQFSEDQVESDRRAVRNLGWFQTVAVDQESVEDGIRLVFRVAENPLIVDVQFEGTREFTSDQLLAVMETKPGEVYNSFRLGRDAQAIEELYRSEGFILAIVMPPAMSAEGAIILTVAEGEIEAIRISGNTRTKEYMIRRYIRTREGETYNDRKVADDVLRLTRLRWFEAVRRDAEVGGEPGKVVLVITVVEQRKTGNASIGGGYSSVQGLVGFIDLSKRNLRGTGQAVRVRGEFGGRTSYELNYSHPWIMTPETRLNLGVYNRLIVREAFVTDEEGARRGVLYDERRSGGSVTFGRPVSEHTTFFLGLRRDDVRISGLTEEDEEFLTGAAFERREVGSITLAAVTDTRRSDYNPRSGAYRQLSIEFAGPLGGVEFTKYVTDLRRYFPVGAKNAFALRLLAGTVTGDAPFLEQFLVGGGESLRGYQSDRFVGTSMAILNAEYRINVNDNLLAVLFVDVGDAWGGPVAMDPALRDTVRDEFTANTGYGVGVRVRTPIGPLRLDLGFGDEGTETHFGVRHMF